LNDEDPVVTYRATAFGRWHIREKARVGESDQARHAKRPCRTFSIGRSIEDCSGSPSIKASPEQP